MQNRSATPLFWIVFGALTLLAAIPFWRTQILPMQDYPHFLVFARAFADMRDKGSPFFGAYTTGFPLSPVVLPLLLTRALAALVGLEQAGRVMWTIYAVSLPLASLHLLRVLGRSPWAVLLVFPLVISYWVIGGFFAFATAMPLFVLGLALTVRWLEDPTWPRGIALAAVLAALHLWHALVFAQLLFDAGVLWLLFRFDDRRARLAALLPAGPPLAIFAAWMLATVHGRSPGSRPAVWPRFFENAASFFEYVGPILPGAAGAALLLAAVLAAGTLARSAPSPRGRFRAANPFAILAILAVISFAIVPAAIFGVEGIHNRQPWIAAILFVFGWSLPSSRVARAGILVTVGAASAAALIHLGSRFAEFHRESAGASRLIDRLAPGQTLLGPIGGGATASFPGHPLVAVELYATIRKGGLPNTSFAGYDINFIRYAGDRNPMPGIRPSVWLDHRELPRFDYVLTRGATEVIEKRPKTARLVARDGEFSLFAVCGGRALPRCP